MPRAISTMISNALVLFLFYRIFLYFTKTGPDAQSRQRKATPLSFDDGISWERLQSMARTARRKHKNIDSVTVDTQGVFTMRWHSNSRKSDYEAYLDFNDWGHLTGRFWKSGVATEMDAVHNVQDYLSACISKETSYR